MIGWDNLREIFSYGYEPSRLASVVRSLGICNSRGLPFRLLTDQQRTTPLPTKSENAWGLPHPFSDEDDDEPHRRGGIRLPDEPHCLLSLERADTDTLASLRRRLLSGIDAEWLDCWYADPAAPSLTKLFLSLCQAPRSGLSYQGKRALQNANKGAL